MTSRFAPINRLLKSTVLFIIAAVWGSAAGRHVPASAGCSAHTRALPPATSFASTASDSAFVSTIDMLPSTSGHLLLPPEIRRIETTGDFFAQRRRQTT